MRALTGEFYAAYAKQDLDALFRLWSAKAPELAARRQAMQKFFAGHDKIECKGPMIRKMAVEGEKAKLRVEVEVTAIEVKTGKPATDLGKMMRVLEGVKEDGAWKIWREASAEEDLAAALVMLKTDDERSALLTAEREMVTGRLVREINKQGVGPYLQGDYAKALAAFRAALKIAEQIGDKAGIASALQNIGNVYHLRGNYAQALEHYEKSLAVFETLGGKDGIARALANIGIVHSMQGNYVQALENFQKSLTLSEAFGNKYGIASMLGNIGIVQYSQGNYTQALENFEKCLTLMETLGTWRGLPEH